MGFGEILYKLRKKKKLMQEDIAKQIGVQKNTISNYENNISKPNYDKLVQLCNLFQVSPNDLMRDDFNADNVLDLPLDHQELKDKYNNLSTHDKSIVDYIFGMEEEEVEPTKLYHFPVFFQSAAAGIGQLSDPSIYKMEEFELQSIPKKFAFGMYIEGDSMKDDILDNDIVLIDPTITQPGELHDEIVVALFGEELICKRLSVNSFERSYDFNSDNSSKEKESRKNQKQSDFKIVGKVVGVIHR